MSDILNELNEMFDEAIANADKRTLGEILKDQREELKLKASDIAKITNLSESLISKIEGDRVDDMKISTMKRLCMAYNLSPNIFITYMGREDDLKTISQKQSSMIVARKILTESNKENSQDKIRIGNKGHLIVGNCAVCGRPASAKHIVLATIKEIHPYLFESEQDPRGLKLLHRCRGGGLAEASEMIPAKYFLPV